MTVAELIVLLQAQDQTLEAWVHTECHGCSDPVSRVGPLGGVLFIESDEH